MKPRYLLAILPALALTLLLLWPNTAQAQEDVTPPVLISITFEPTSIDTTQGAQVITVTANITDDLSGFRFAQAKFESGRTEQWSEVHFYNEDNKPRFWTEKTPGGLRYKASFELPQYSAYGSWRMTFVRLYDNVGNSIDYDYPDEPERDSSVEVWPAHFNSFTFHNGSPDAVPERTLYLPALLR